MAGRSRSRRNVTNTIAREQAEKLATSVPGVVGVENQIKVLKAETPADSAPEN